MFHSFEPEQGGWVYCMARKTLNVPWTLYCSVPDRIIAQYSKPIGRQKVALSAAIIVIVVLASLLFALAFLRPIQALSVEAEALGNGDLSAQTHLERKDELGRLAQRFNGMAERIQIQTEALESTRDDLEIGVPERTAELVESAKKLELQGDEKVRLEGLLRKLSEQVSLLQRINRSIGARDDSDAVFSASIGFLELHLLIDFGCICLRSSDREELTVVYVGSKGAAGAKALPVEDRESLSLRESILSKGMQGHLVTGCEADPDPSPLWQRFADVGLHSLVVVPLQKDSTIYGLLLAARATQDSFAPEECAFLKQLGEQIAVSLDQAELRSTLEAAQRDLRQSRQS